MKRTVKEIKQEAKHRGILKLEKRDLIYLGIMFSLEDLVEKVSQVN